jgi:hypothetical protein
VVFFALPAVLLGTASKMRYCGPAPATTRELVAGGANGGAVVPMVVTMVVVIVNNNNAQQWRLSKKVVSTALSQIID